MSVNSFEELVYHVGHEVEVVGYGNDEVGTVNAAIQCEECGTILLDYDRPDIAEEA
jgi:hypothetical protein